MEIVYAKLQNFSLFFLDGAAYFLVAMIGAFVKDIFDTVVGTRRRIETRRIFVGTILSTFLTFAARGYLEGDLLIAINFFLGIIGWELFCRTCTIRGLEETVLGFRKFQKAFFSGKSLKEEEAEEDTEKEENSGKK